MREEGAHPEKEEEGKSLELGRGIRDEQECRDLVQSLDSSLGLFNGG